MMEKKNSWKRFVAWVTALKDRPLRSARLKLTALYVLNTFIILCAFVIILGVFRSSYLTKSLHGQLRNPAMEAAVIKEISDDFQGITIILAIFVLLAIGILSYVSVQLTLRPIKIFLEGHRRFIADASHELRTPLAVMRTEIEVAMLDPDSITHKEAIEILQSNAEEIDRMSKILTNLLNLASFNDVAGAPPMTAVNLKEVIEATIHKVQKIAATKEITITTNQLEDVRVFGNPTALEEVALNLLKNALNYSPKNSRVTITLRELNDRYAELIIKDNGIGIAADELPHVFEPFYRSERSLHMYKSGSGLGLPLVKEMIKRHKGSISIESAPDKGTAITVLLPLAQKVANSD